MYTLKKDLIAKYAMLPRTDDLKNNKLVIVTAAGIIQGNLVSNETESSIEIMKAITNKFIDDYREESNIPKGALLDGNDGCLLLEDVMLTCGSTVFPFQFLTVFFDQIIAVTIGGNPTD